MRNFCFALLALLFSGNIAIAQFGISTSITDHYEGLGYYFKPAFEIGITDHSVDDMDHLAYRAELSYALFSPRYDTIASFYVDENHSRVGPGLKNAWSFYESLKILSGGLEVEYHPIAKRQFSPFVSLGLGFKAWDIKYASYNGRVLFEGEESFLDGIMMGRIGLAYYTSRIYWSLDFGAVQKVIGESPLQQTYLQSRLTAVYLF